MNNHLLIDLLENFYKYVSSAGASLPYYVVYLRQVLGHFRSGMEIEILSPCYR